MKVFLSWSGVRSKHIALGLRDWLQNVIQIVEPFISASDIHKGVRGSSVIAKELAMADVGIVCLTPENLTASWILFEAGALSKVASAHVCTLLYDLEPSDVPPPLGEFQHTTKINKPEMSALIRTINGLLGESALATDRLVASFDIWWDTLQNHLDQMPEIPSTETIPDPRPEGSKTDEMLDILRQLRTTTTSSARYVFPIQSMVDASMPVTDLPKFLQLVASDIIMKDRLSPDLLATLLQKEFVTVDNSGILNVTPRGKNYMHGRKSLDTQQGSLFTGVLGGGPMGSGALGG